MGESYIGIDETTVDKKLHTWSRTVGANTVEDALYVPGEFPLATYSISVTAISAATAAAHCLQIMNGANNYLRIRRIRIRQLALPSAAVVRFELYRLSTAGTGGTTANVVKFDAGDSASGATAMTLPTAKGTEGDRLWSDLLGATASNPSTEINSVNWHQLPNEKPFIVPPGTSNGVALKTSGLSSLTVDIYVEFVETTFL